MALVVDTSVLVKCVIPEQDSEAAENLVALHRAGALNLIAPEYVLVESANVLWKHQQRGNLQVEEAEMSLRALIDLGVRLVSNAELLENALALAANSGITVYDGLFCALAAREGNTLITADMALVRSTSGSGVRTITLSEWDGLG